MQENGGVPILINLSALASYNGVPGDPAQLVTTGRLIPARDGALLTYPEVLQDETGDTSEAEVELVLRRDQITMNRVGDFSSTMHFRRNKRFETKYHTPYGDMNMSLMTREARWTGKPEAGSVHLCYDVSMQGSYATTNEIHLEYWRQPGQE